ncbi:J domain-containing protein [Pseudopedobacter beijingensis]|uniref:J domain-containing protein n=1 Tax=Pseudopedobacter beijingensis TaxID=1207056 RepID=A0ABW4ICM8_9SPHI
MKNYYQTLGLDPTCSNEEIKSAFKEYAKHYHPDKHQGNTFFADKFIEVKEAYDNLIDYQKRKVHDDFHNFNQTQQSNSNHHSQHQHTTTDHSQTRASKSQSAITEDNYCEWAFERVEGNDYYGALEEIGKGFEKFPKSSLLTYCEGKVQEAFGYYVRARKCYKKAFDGGIIEAKTDTIRIENLFTNAIGVATKHQMNGIFFCIVGIIITVIFKAFDNLFMGAMIGTIVNLVGGILLSRRMFNELPKSLVDSLGYYSCKTNLYALFLIACAMGSSGLTAYLIS